MSDSMCIYSIPECSTEDEASDHDYCEPTRISNESETVLIHSFSSTTTNEVALSDSSTYKVSNVEPSDSRENDNDSERKIADRFPPTLINISEFSSEKDNDVSKEDNTSLFANTASCDISGQRIPNPYQKNEDCNSSSKEAYEKLLLKPLNTVTSTNWSVSVQHFEEILTEPLPQSNQNEKCNSPSTKNNTTANNFDKYSEKHLSATDLTMPVLQPSRGRSGSVQWIQNMLQNIDHRYRSLLDLRRPSDLAEEGIRKSNEMIEMDPSEDESSKGGRRYSENIIGKQKRSPFSTGIGHLRDLWKDKHDIKKQENKEIDQIRSDVCPLFNFPRKYDEDEAILDALRQVMRKCTIQDPSARPSSSAVMEQLSQIII